MKLMDVAARIEAIEAELATIRESRRVPPRPLGPWSISDRMPETEWLRRFIEGGLQQARADIADYVLRLEDHIHQLEKTIDTSDRRCDSVQVLNHKTT